MKKVIFKIIYDSYFMRKLYYLAILLLLACVDKQRPAEVSKVEIKKNEPGNKFIHPFNKYKNTVDCLDDRFQQYPQGMKIGGIKICQQVNGDPLEFFIIFQRNGQAPICFIPMHMYEDKTKENLGDPICVEQSKDQNIKIKFQLNRKGKNLKGDSFSGLMLNSVFIVRDEANALSQLKCCLNASYYNEPGSGLPYPRCTFEYKLNICSEFLVNYKGNYVHHLNY